MHHPQYSKRMSNFDWSDHWIAFHLGSGRVKWYWLQSIQWEILDSEIFPAATSTTGCFQSRATRRPKDQSHSVADRDFSRVSKSFINVLTIDEEIPKLLTVLPWEMSSNCQNWLQSISGHLSLSLSLFLKPSHFNTHLEIYPTFKHLSFVFSFEKTDNTGVWYTALGNC